MYMVVVAVEEGAGEDAEGDVAGDAGEGLKGFSSFGISGLQSLRRRSMVNV